MAKDKKKKKYSSHANYLGIFSMRELSKLSGVDYSRIYHVATGNRVDGFTDEETERLSKTIIKEVNIALEALGTTKRVTSID